VGLQPDIELPDHGSAHVDEYLTKTSPHQLPDRLLTNYPTNQDLIWYDALGHCQVRSDSICDLIEVPYKPALICFMVGLLGTKPSPPPGFLVRRVYYIVRILVRPACDRPRNSNRDRVAHRSDNSVVTLLGTTARS